MTATHRPPGQLRWPGGHALSGEIVRFALVGLVGTAAFMALYLLLRQAMGAQPASLIARILVAIPTSIVNARFTFRSDAGSARAGAAGLSALAVGAGLCSGSLALASAAGAHGRVVEVAALLVANVIAAAGRFLLLKLALPSRQRTGAHSDLPPSSQRRTSAGTDRRPHAGAHRAA